MAERRESSPKTLGSLKMDSCLVLTECFSRQILRFRTSAIDLIHSERVLTSTSSFFSHRLAYSSHVSMIMPKFWCHECETGSLDFGPLLERSLSCTLRSPVTIRSHGAYSVEFHHSKKTSVFVHFYFQWNRIERFTNNIMNPNPDSQIRKYITFLPF